ncbi:MAG TPA: HipA domain-containing protein [Acidobacteriaceae bacterium]
MSYPILSVRSEEIVDVEQLGSKPKFWFRQDDQLWLFKEARANTGEDWAEKVAAEIAKLVGMPAARVELAEYEGKRGCASLNFVNVDAGEVLMHGNELLAGQVLGYDKHKRQHQTDHTLQNIESTIRKIFPEDKGVGLLRQLATYATLDALIGNTDRHHENWGLLFSLELAAKRSSVIVAPSFDHASSLGRELTDAHREEMLRAGRIGRYIERAHGGIYIESSDRHGANPLDLIRLGCLRFPDYFLNGRERFLGLNLDAVETVISDVPEDRMSKTARQFALEMVRISSDRLRRLPV